ncbi:MAG: alpha amylase C-terminal domain-containing protein, partial [Bacteroidetes bacterium]|nr:alpha amylase C-terminal domain-containing protein [Bacteroidota bacterium]
MKDCVAALNKLLKKEPALHENQFSIYGFEWVDLDHRAESVIAFKRKAKDKSEDLLIILNMTPVIRNDWQVYTNGKAYTKEIFNSDSKDFWGTGNVFNPEIRCELVDKEQERYKLVVNLPPLAGIILK